MLGVFKHINLFHIKPFICSIKLIPFVCISHLGASHQMPALVFTIVIILRCHSRLLFSSSRKLFSVWTQCQTFLVPAAPWQTLFHKLLQISFIIHRFVFCASTQVLDYVASQRILSTVYWRLVWGVSLQSATMQGKCAHVCLVQMQVLKLFWNDCVYRGEFVSVWIHTCITGEYSWSLIYHYFCRQGHWLSVNF